MRCTSVLVRLFQSTLSMRRATLPFYNKKSGGMISIHALHEESDATRTQCTSRSEFQSTLSMRRATLGGHATVDVPAVISIHALHEESDVPLSSIVDVTAGFQSTLSMRRAT